MVIVIDVRTLLNDLVVVFVMEFVGSHHGGSLGGRSHKESRSIF